MVVALLVSGCSTPAEVHSSISTGTDGLRTYSVIREADGHLVTCGMPAVASPVEGTLHGRADGDGDPVWLERSNGQRVFVVWPDGFHVRFEPDAVLSNEHGVVVARDGDAVSLPQVPGASARGTRDDPYIAACWVFGQVYVFKP